MICAFAASQSCSSIPGAIGNYGISGRRNQIVYQGFWTLTANAAILAQDVVLRLAQRYKRSPAQIFYRYLTQIGIVPLIGTTSNQHMREDLAIFEFELLPSECESLNGLI